MKSRNGIVLCIIVLIACAGFAQQKPVVSVYTGYSMTAFENQESAAGTLPLGVTVGLGVAPALEIGGEFMYPIGGYKFETTDPDMGKITQTFNQMMIGLYGKYSLGSGNTKPFIKAGLGYYTGNVKVETDGGSETVDVKSKLGFNLGGGVQMNSGLFAAFTYNIITREYMSTDFSMNTWAVLVGYQIIK